MLHLFDTAGLDLSLADLPDLPESSSAVKDFEGEASLPEPTHHLAGTLEKCQVLARRARLGQALHHPLDGVVIVGTLKAGRTRSGRKSRAGARRPSEVALAALARADHAARMRQCRARAKALKLANTRDQYEQEAVIAATYRQDRKKSAIFSDEPNTSVDAA